MNENMVNRLLDKRFQPIFVVGAPRSGTTLLAVLLDRHSHIAIPPETQFFADFIPSLPGTSKTTNRSEKIALALSYHRIQDVGLQKEQLEEAFSHLPNTWPCLLQAVLEIYALGQNKNRVGEKSPKHVGHVPEILKVFPDARIICLVRDGRDVVRSLQNVPWAEPDNSRRLNIFCMEWADYAELAVGYHEQYSKEQFLLVKYEDVLLSPRGELEKISHFIGEEFEEGQLDVTAKSNVVPGWESEWKNKSTAMLDPERVEAWRRQADREQVWFMNSMMGKSLELLGYKDSDLNDCPVLKKWALFLKKVPYLPRIRPISLIVLKILRSIRVTN